MGRFILRLILGVILSIAVTTEAAAQSSQASAANASCGATQTTLITPNSQAVTASLNNANNEITIALRTGNVTYWTVLLSNAVVDVALSSDRGNAVVIFKKGLALHLTANGSAGFNVFLNGTIIDDSTTYALTGVYLGAFAC